MKIAYINIIYSSSSIGIKERFFDKAAEAESFDHDIDFYILNPLSEEQVGQVQFVKIKPKAFPLNVIESLTRRYDLIERSIDLTPYDFIVLRYPGADRSGIRFTRKFNVVTEHHTDKAGELLSNINSRISLKTTIMNLIAYILEKKYGGRILKNCKGIIAVTKEIKTIELKKTDCNIPSIVITNGIRVKKVTQTGFKKFDGEKIDIVFLAGSFAPWHGIDRLLKSITAYKGNLKIILHIVGNIDKEKITHYIANLSNIQFYGVRTGIDLDKIMQNMTIAVGSLGLYKNDMQEGCTLKVREYTARGIPFIVAYDDPDLQNIDLENQFYLPFPNNGSLIEIDKIIGFALNMSNNSTAISEYMRAYAFKHMDWSIKMKKFFEFMERISMDNC